MVNKRILGSLLPFLALVAWLSPAWADDETASPTPSPTPSNQSPVVYTDEGWYQASPDPTPQEKPGEVIVLHLESPLLSAPSPSLAGGMRPGPVRGPSLMSAEGANSEGCLAERGAWMRRVLELRGWSISRLDLSDRGLGQLGVGGSLSAPFGWDPDTQLGMGLTPVPLGALSFDSELQSDALELLRCQAGE